MSGIVVGAAGTHIGGGDLARVASTFLLIHAVAVLGLGVGASSVRQPWLFWIPGGLMAVGAAAFSGDLTLLAFMDSHAIRFLAPVGGILMILGWTALIILPWIVGRSPPVEL